MATTVRLAFTTRELHTAAKQLTSKLITFDLPHYLVPLERGGWPPLRIIRARAVKGSTQVQLLSTGAWCELQPGDKIFA